MNKYKIDEKVILFESFMGRQMSCSPKALYRAMLRDEKYKDYKKVWAFVTPKQHQELLQEGNTIVVEYKSKEYYKYCAMAKYWVTNSRMPKELIPKKEQEYVQCWHGTPLKRLGYDIKMYNGSRRATAELRKTYDTDARRYTYLLSPSDFYTEKITSAFHLKELKKEDIFIQEGYPRNDYLYEYTNAAVLSIKEKLQILDGKKVILYAPTWRENQHKAGVGYTYDLGVDFDKLYEQLRDDYVILFRAHYFVANAFDFEKYKGFVIDVCHYDDINHLYVASDMLITDYSSAFFDYANLNRPILFYMYDFDMYKNNMRDFYIDIEELPGPILKKEDELIEAIKIYGSKEFEPDDKYNTFNDRFNPYRYPCSKTVLEKIITNQI